MGRMPATITLSHGQRGKRAGLSELLHGDIFLSGSAEQKLGCPPDMENRWMVIILEKFRKIM